MYLTKDTIKAAKVFFLCMLMTAILTKFSAYLGIYVRYLNSGEDLLFSIKTLLFFFFDSLRVVVFWVAIYIIVKDKKAVIIAGSLAQFLMMLLFVFLNFEGGVYTPTDFYQDHPYFYALIFSLCRFVPFFVLGILTSNTIKASLCFMIFVLCDNISGFYFDEYYQIIENLFDSIFYIRLDDVFSIKYNISSSYNSINLVKMLLEPISNVARIIIFGVIYTSIKMRGSIKDFLHSITIEKSTSFSMSFIHWMLRLNLIFTLFCLEKYLRWNGAPYHLLTFSFYFFFTLIIYRNVLVSLFISRKRFISWGYFWLNIPYVHIFSWIHHMLKRPSKKFLDYQKDGEHNLETAIRRFKLKNRNIDIASLVGLLILIYFLLGVTKMHGEISFWMITVFSIANIIIHYHSKWFAYVWVLLVVIVNMVLLFFDLDILVPIEYSFLSVLVYHPLYHLGMYKVNHIDKIERVTE